MSDPQAPSDLSDQELAFCEASIRDWHGRAARMLAANPEIAGYGFATAVVLGDAARVRAAITRDPAVATRPDTRTGWTALHVACASRWHRLAIGRATLAACRAAYDRWSVRADADLTVYLDAVLTALAAGFGGTWTSTAPSATP
jgi:hypothetical protein